jgi:hypothetical protein
MTLQLQEGSGSIAGSCQITEPPYWTRTVSGTHSHPDISLVITEPGFTPLTVVGAFSGANRINATLSGTAGWTNTPVTFERQ